MTPCIPCWLGGAAGLTSRGAPQEDPIGMHSKWIVAAFALFTGGAAGVARASDALPANVSSYTSEGAAANASFARDDRDFSFSLDEPAAGAAKQQSYWPVLYSLLVPGVGELTMGYKVRGFALVAIDIAAWAGYFVNHDDGMQMRDEYEAYADQYWTQQKFIDDHPLVYPQTGWTQDQLEEAGRAVSGSGGDWWTGYIPWVSKEDDKQHYYENIGKYDWFLSGWSDYNPALPPPAPQSDLRDTYREMRNESNSELDHANEFLWLNFAARAFSVIETAIIVHNRREDATQSGALGLDMPVAVRARPRGQRGAELALEVRFK